MTGGVGGPVSISTVEQMVRSNHPGTQRSERGSPRRRLLLLALLIAALFAVVAVTLGRSPEELRQTVSSFGTIAPLLFMVVWIVATPALFPGTVLGAAGGLLFGTTLGLCVSIAGATLGAIVSFLLARRLGHDAAERLSGPRLERLNRRIEQHGFRAVFLARAAPGVPAGLLYYAAGLSRVRLSHFAAGVLVGGAPRVFAYSALGGSAHDPGSPAAVAAFLLIGLPPVAIAAVALSRRLVRARAAR
jgi:uncharacterized membrane protein YdjX (TVP38/TMEM64 family)